MTTIARSDWVSWFVDGRAEHFPVDSPTGGQICAKLGWDIVERATPTRRGAPRQPKRTEGTCVRCGASFTGPAGKSYCTKQCSRDAYEDRTGRRTGREAPVDAGVAGSAETPLPETGPES